MEPLYIAIASFVGALAAALLGWTESKEAFDIKRFGASLLRGLIAAALTGISTQAMDLGVGWYLYLSAFLVGAGIDVLGKRGATVALNLRK